MDFQLITAVLTRDEGVGTPARPGRAYTDSVGIPTVGIGRNIRNTGFTPHEMRHLLPQDMSAQAFLTHIADDTVTIKRSRFTFSSVQKWESVVGVEPLSQDTMHYLLQNDIDIAADAGRRICTTKLWKWHLPDYVREVIVQVIFTLGETSFKEFKKCIAAIRKEDFQTAGKELLDSRAARQTGERYKRYERVLATGNIKFYEVNYDRH